MTQVASVESHEYLGAYELRHLASHLHAAGAQSYLLRLLVGSPWWLVAKRRHFGGDLEYGADLSLALEGCVEPHSLDALVAVGTLSAARRVIQLRGQHYPYETLEALVWLNREAEALAAARLRPKALSSKNLSNLRSGMRGAERPDGYRYLALVRIFASLHLRDGHADERVVELKRELINEARSSKGPDGNEEFIRALGIKLIELGEFEDVEALATCLDRQLTADSLVKDLIEALAERGEHDRALRLVDLLEDRSDGYWRVFSEAADAGNVDLTLSLLSRIKHPDYYHNRMRVAAAHARAGDVARAEELSADAEPSPLLVSLLCAISHALHTSGLLNARNAILDRTRRTIEELEGDYDWSSTGETRANAWIKLARHLASIGQLTEASAAFDNARAYANQTQTSHEQEQVLRSLCISLIDCGLHLTAEQVVEQSGTLQDWLLLNSTYALVRCGQHEMARRWAEGIREASNRADAFGVLALFGAKDGRLKEAAVLLSLAEAEQRNSYRSDTYLKALCQVAKSGSANAAPFAALAAADEIKRKLEQLKRKRDRNADSMEYVLEFASQGKLAWQKEMEVVLRCLVDQGEGERAASLKTQLKEVAPTIRLSPVARLGDGVGRRPKRRPPVEQIPRIPNLEDSLGGEISAVLRRAESFAAKGDFMRASAAYGKAEDLIEQESERNPFAMDSESFWDSSNRGALVSSLIKSGYYGRALANFDAKDVDAYMLFLTNWRKALGNVSNDGHAAYGALVDATISIIAWEFPRWRFMQS